MARQSHESVEQHGGDGLPGDSPPDLDVAEDVEEQHVIYKQMMDGKVASMRQEMQEMQESLRALREEMQAQRQATHENKITPPRDSYWHMQGHNTAQHLTARRGFPRSVAGLPGSRAGPTHDTFASEPPQVAQ